MLYIKSKFTPEYFDHKLGTVYFSYSATLVTFLEQYHTKV